MTTCWNSFSRDDVPSKRPCIELPCSLGHEEYHMPPLHMSSTWTPMPYPPYFYQHQAEARQVHLAQRSNGDAENLPTSSPSSKLARMKHSRIIGNLANLQVDHDKSSRYDFWGLSAESPLGSTITEDDFLEMVWIPSLAFLLFIPYVNIGTLPILIEFNISAIFT